MDRERNRIVANLLKEPAFGILMKGYGKGKKDIDCAAYGESAGAAFRKKSCPAMGGAADLEGKTAIVTLQESSAGGGKEEEEDRQPACLPLCSETIGSRSPHALCRRG